MVEKLNFYLQNPSYDGHCFLSQVYFQTTNSEISDFWKAPWNFSFSGTRGENLPSSKFIFIDTHLLEGSKLRHNLPTELLHFFLSHVSVTKFRLNGEHLDDKRFLRVRLKFWRLLKYVCQNYNNRISNKNSPLKKNFSSLNRGGYSTCCGLSDQNFLSHFSDMKAIFLVKVKRKIFLKRGGLFRRILNCQIFP